MKKVNVIFALLILFAACENDNNNDILDSDYAEYIVRNSISTDIDFFAVEKYDKYNKPDTASLKFRFITTKIFPDTRYYLVTSVFKKDKELIVRFENVNERDYWSTVTSPAELNVDVPIDIVNLVLINGYKVDRYQINITDEVIEIAPITSKFTNLIYERTFRYPENSFAYICGTNLDNTHLYTDFLDIIADSTSVTKFEFNREGVIPYPISSSGHWSNNASVFFTYEDESEFHKAGDLLKKFTQENLSPNDGVSISLRSWNNKGYMSWLMD